MNVIEEANEKAKERYRDMVLVEMNADAIHVTLNGRHFLNDGEKLDEALKLIAARRDF